MCDDKRYRILELTDMMLDSIHVIQSRTSQIKSANDFLLTPDNTFLLDGICMKLIFMGESVKTIDRLSAGKLFLLFPSISLERNNETERHHRPSLFQDRRRCNLFYNQRRFTPAARCIEANKTILDFGIGS